MSTILQLEIDTTSAAESIRTGRPVTAVCRSGARSSRAVAALTAAGVPATNLTGGMQAWRAAGLPVVMNGESPGTVI